MTATTALILISGLTLMGLAILVTSKMINPKTNPDSQESRDIKKVSNTTMDNWVKTIPAVNNNKTEPSESITLGKVRNNDNYPSG